MTRLHFSWLSEAVWTKQYMKAYVTCKGCTSMTPISLWNRARTSLTGCQWLVTDLQHILSSTCLTLLRWKKNISICLSSPPLAASGTAKKSRTGQSCSTQIELCNIVNQHKQWVMRSHYNSIIPASAAAISCLFFCNVCFIKTTNAMIYTKHLFGRLQWKYKVCSLQCVCK